MSDPQTSGARGSYAKSAGFRRAVLDTALRILAERGFDATTLQLIADEVGRSKAGLLHHFGSRENLMLEIVRHRDDVNRARFPADPDGGFGASEDLVAHNATVPGLVALFAVVSALAASDTSDTDRREYFIARYERNREAFARRLSQEQQAGTIRADVDPHVAASLLIATMDGLQVQWLLDERVDMAEHLRALVDLLSP
ncbi:TetR/AcrR family transcriptional regulator [Microbacterium sp. Marseille-Q6648]|uniref:TetR/AcrR family transcriptional regulator n=1 Tax=Microbacterium sp. Marseille-Q6648 TaxID=2937991 RepID=UPI00203E7D48|nr:TetR/AcrR family transcriptional regulator [Microbacterium sp. Marseille-Q6648]